jgi:hypothetical protein
VIESSPGSELPEPGLLFLIRTSHKTAFSLLLHRQRNSLAKRKPDENGVLLKKKQPKAHAHYSKFYATTYIKAVYQIDIKYNVKYGTNKVHFRTRECLPG